MISDEEFDRTERELEELFGFRKVEFAPEVDSKRIDRIVEKAMYEAVVKDTTSFVFNSFGSAIFGLAGAVLGQASSGFPAGDGGRAENNEERRS